MSKEQDGGPAFPQMQCRDEDGRWSPARVDGLSMRDWFAGQALVGLLLDSERLKGVTDEIEFARSAYQQADAMLEARKQ